MCLRPACGVCALFAAPGRCRVFSPRTIHTRAPVHAASALRRLMRDRLLLLARSGAMDAELVAKILAPDLSAAAGQRTRPHEPAPPTPAHARGSGAGTQPLPSGLRSSAPRAARPAVADAAVALPVVEGVRTGVHSPGRAFSAHSPWTRPGE